MLFLSKSGGSWCSKRWFYRQKTAVIASRNGGSWNWFVLLYISKHSISLIINAFCVMLKTSVFHHRRTMCRQISDMCVVRTAFLLNLFTASGSSRKRRQKPDSEMPLTLSQQLFAIAMVQSNHQWFRMSVLCPVPLYVALPSIRGRKRGRGRHRQFRARYMWRQAGCWMWRIR